MTKQTLTVLNTEQLVEKLTKTYCEVLKASLDKWVADAGLCKIWETKYIYETGRKYFKVIKVEESFTSKNGVKHPSHTCVEAFIDRQTGDLYKPASYKKPAKGVRYNLRDQKSLISLYQNLDPFGGHLYNNRGVL